MTIAQEIKEIVELARDLGNEDLYQRLRNLQGDVLDLLDRAHTNADHLAAQAKRIKDLQDKLEDKSKMKFVDTVYFMKDDSGRPIHTAVSMAKATSSIQARICSPWHQYAWSICVTVWKIMNTFGRLHN